jgi:hypothetical protein
VPFRHPDRSADLAARIEFEVRERVEEAVDHACLEALVRGRRARGLPAPVADSPADKQAYEAGVVTFLRLLQHEIAAGLAPEARRKLDAPVSADDEESRLVTVQVRLARTLPDYWQRFDAIRARYLAEAAQQDPSGSGPPDVRSGGEGRGLLARLFGRS